MRSTSLVVSHDNRLDPGLKEKKREEKRKELSADPVLSGGWRLRSVDGPAKALPKAFLPSIRPVVPQSSMPVASGVNCRLCRHNMSEAVHDSLT